MKKYLLAILAAGVLVSCSKESGQDGDQGVITDEIALASGKVVSSTKAPIESENTDLPKVAQTVSFLRLSDQANATAAAADWNEAGISAPATTGGRAKGRIDALIGTDGSVQFRAAGTTTEEKQYYNSNPSLYSWMVGYAPAATLTEDAGANPVKAEWAINGTTDVIVCDALGANKAIKKTASPHLTPQFHHLLSWIEFQVLADGQEAIDTWGGVQSITIVNTANKVEYSLAPFAATTPTATFSGTQNLATKTYPADGTPALQALTTTSALYSYALTEPNKAYYEVTVVTKKGTDTAVTTELHYNAVPANDKSITIAGNSKAGSKHVITLTFTSSEITATATIKHWESGAPGNATIE